MEAKIAELVAKLRAQATLIETTDAGLIDALTMYDLDKAYRQFAASIERTLEDARRRSDEGLMVK